MVEELQVVPPFTMLLEHLFEFGLCGLRVPLHLSDVLEYDELVEFSSTIKIAEVYSIRDLQWWRAQNFVHTLLY